MYKKTARANDIKEEKIKNINKLSYKDKRLLEVLPNEINEIENEIFYIENLLATDTQLYINDAKKFDELTEKLEKLKSQKDEKETMWLEIELKAEQLDC